MSNTALSSLRQVITEHGFNSPEHDAWTPSQAELDAYVIAKLNPLRQPLGELVAWARATWDAAGPDSNPGDVSRAFAVLDHYGYNYSLI